MNDDWINRFMVSVDEKIRLYGHSTVSVLPGKEPDDFAYTYTVGMAEKGWPELILTSLHPKTGEMILVEVVKRLRHLNEVPEAGMIVEKALNVPIKLGAVSAIQIPKRFKIAMNRVNQLGLPDEAVTALQAIWPDTEGKFPGDPGYDRENFPQVIMLDS